MSIKIRIADRDYPMRVNEEEEERLRAAGRLLNERRVLLGHLVELPNSDWVASNHWCVPLYYAGDREREEALTA